jgi:hypothetical protein
MSEGVYQGAFRNVGWKRRIFMKRLRVISSVLPLLVLCLSGSAAFGQSPNLVLNPSFEAYTGTPSCDHPDQSMTAAHADYWTVTDDGSPDYWHVDIDYWCLAPDASPRTGDAHVGFAFGGSSRPLYREYVQSAPPIQLYHAKSYLVEFYIKRWGGYGTTCVGMHFSTNRIQYAFGVTPDISETRSSFSGYVKISGVYTPPADGSYYITLGAFDTDSIPNGQYFFIDDVSIREITPPIIYAQYTCEWGGVPANCAINLGETISFSECDENDIAIYIDGTDYLDADLTMTLTGADVSGMVTECMTTYCNKVSQQEFTGEDGHVGIKITWDPEWDQYGTHPIGVTVSSQYGLVANFNFTVRVTPCGHPCCYEGECYMWTCETCTRMGGEFHPELESCDPNPCPQVVCCMPNGSCAFVEDELSCTQAGGEVLYGCSYCTPNPCPDVVCCFEDGTCQIMRLCDCKNEPNAWWFDLEDCIPNECPQPCVCCFKDGSCQILHPTVCGRSGGTPRPDLSSCDPNLCPPGCATPPYGMIAWWPLDDVPGVHGLTCIDLVGDKYLYHNGVPVPIIGEHVVNSHHFEGADDYLRTPPHDADYSLKIVEGDLSIDCWVRTNVTYPGIRTIVDKRGFPNGAGFALFIGEAGYIGFQLADPVGYTNWPSSGYVTDGAWHHVAVTVDRDEPNQGGKIYVDGVVEGTFDPTGRSGNIANSGPIRIGQRNVSDPEPFQGDIDEVQIFSRALGEDEVVAIYEADISGKCKESCFISPFVSICEGNASTKAYLSIGNFTRYLQGYDWEITGLPGGTIHGDEAEYDPQSGVVDYADIGYTTIPIIITPPSTLNLHETMRFRVSVYSSTGFSCHSDCTVQSISWIDCYGGSIGGGITDDTHIELRFGLIEDVGIGVRNDTEVRDTFFYELRAMSAGGDAPRHIVSLDGMAPGDSVTGNVIVEPYDSTTISVDVLFTEHDPFVPHSLVLLRDLDGDGIGEGVASFMMQCISAEEPSTAVHVISFSAVEREGYVEVRWTTATEIDNAGFNVYRSESEDGMKVRLNDRLIPAVGDELKGATYTFKDHDISADESYYYWFEDINVDGIARMNGPALLERGDTPAAFRLAQNVPNPFNPVTDIRYALATDCHVRLEIFNVLGQRVTTLVDGRETAGYRSARWDGKNADGVDVSSGVYFYKLVAGTFTDTKKMVLLR